MQPGQVISPNGSDQPGLPSDGSPEPVRPPEQPADPAPMPAPAPEPAATPVVAVAPVEPVAPTPVPPVAAEPQPLPPQAPLETAPDPVPADGAWQFRQEADPTLSASAQAAALPDDISWTASEFIEHQKGFGWYGLLAVASVILAAVDYLITKDKVSTGVILVAGIAFGIYASTKPRSTQYSLTRQGLRIGEKFYGFQDFKTFSLAEEGSIISIVLMPLKRFMPPLTIYVAPDMEERIIDYLSSILPFEQHKSDAVDSLLRRIRF